MSSLKIFGSPSARDRLNAGRRFIESFPASAEILLVSASRAAADDFARAISADHGATFGFHRFSLVQLVSRLASMELARQGLAPATRLGTEAVAARAAFEALQRGSLRYVEPVIGCRGFARTLAETCSDLRLAGVTSVALEQLGDLGADLHELVARYEEQLALARLADRAALLRIATSVIRRGTLSFPITGPALLLDVSVDTCAEQEFVAALAVASQQVFACVPAGDERTRAALIGLPNAEQIGSVDGDEPRDPLDRVRRYLFALDVPPPDPQPPTPDPQSVSFFSAPGEGRECVEVARRVLEEARHGVPFDHMAILLRAPTLYSGLLETALRRADVPAWFARGTKVPDPSGRAFLALLACASEGLSARRFSEYLSLGQVPDLELATGAPPTDREVWVAPADEDSVLPTPRVPGKGQLSLLDLVSEPAGPADVGPRCQPASGRRPGESGIRDADEVPVLEGTLRAPWRWDRLLVESAVIGGYDRWVRRLDGLTRELEIKLDECADDGPDSPRLLAITRDLRNLNHLRRFALPVIEALAALPTQAPWGEWLLALERLAPMVLRHPERALGVLAELRPMAAVGAVSLEEVREVLSERLSLLQEEPPQRRYGHVFVGTPDHARGRLFDVVFVPGLAERIFPQKLRQDPLLLDAFREMLNTVAGRSPEYPNGGSGQFAGSAPGPSSRFPVAEDRGLLGLPVQDDRASRERLLLHLAAGAAGQRLYLSYPRMELGEGRPRVPSFYGLDIERAMTGRVPDFQDFEREAFAEAEARLAWPAPRDPAQAIDATEHDLAVLLPLLHRPVAEQVKGRARYLLELSTPLSQSLRTRWARWLKKWSRYDGLYKPEPGAQRALADHRVFARPYSVSALQKFALCPYQFLLSAIYRFEPRPEAGPLEKMDPLTRGHMFHRVQADLMRELKRRGLLSVTSATLDKALTLLDRTLKTVAEHYREQLAPAIDRVWRDEVESMRGDLRGWLQRVAVADAEWEPIHAEFGFGIAGEEGLDPESVREPVVLEGRWKLHGVVDLIERHRRSGELRVTDHKSGANWTKGGMVVGGGEALQPVLYGLAVEVALRQPVAEARLSYCTAKGGFTDRVVPLKEEALNSARRRGIEVLEIVDRAIEQGILAPAPRDGACRWCDFHEVCGPWEETRVKRKDPRPLADLAELRGMP